VPEPVSEPPAAEAGPGLQRTSERLAVEKDLSSYRTILKFGGPLALSMTGLVIMQILDRIFLTWYSEEAVAACGPAGMASWLLASFFVGTAGYTATFVAQYIGAGRPQQCGAVVWQGIRFALWSGALVASAALLGGPLFEAVNHSGSVKHLEIVFFGVMCLGAPVSILGSALSGFFAGRGATRTLMVVQVSGHLLNAVLAYGLIFGNLGLPEWGVLGAATANVAAQTVVAAVLFALFLRKRNRLRYGTGNAALNPRLLWQLLSYGLPNGARFAIEMLAWTVFLFFIGRVGQDEKGRGGELELAATNIVWGINAIAIFPLIGFSIAIGTLVGHAQGRRQPDLAAKCTWRGLAVGQAWMMSCALLFLSAPGPILELFHGRHGMPQERFQELAELATVLLRFVAVYCLVDGFNVILMGALQGAGDTRWTLAVSLLLHLFFLGGLAAVDAFHRDWRAALGEPWGLSGERFGLYLEWSLAAVFVMLMAVVWMMRFRTGGWRKKQVIEPEW
jgi:MATE family multidrug resistance protein